MDPGENGQKLPRRLPRESYYQKTVDLIVHRAFKFFFYNSADIELAVFVVSKGICPADVLCRNFWADQSNVQLMSIDQIHKSYAAKIRVSSSMLLY